MNHRKHLERILSWAWLIIIFLAERKWEGWTNLIIWRSEWSLSEWWEQWRGFEFVLSLLWSGDTANMTSRPAEGCFYLDISIFLASFYEWSKNKWRAHINTTPSTLADKTVSVLLTSCTVAHQRAETWTEKPGERDEPIQPTPKAAGVWPFHFPPLGKSGGAAMWPTLWCFSKVLGVEPRDSAHAGKGSAMELQPQSQC